MRSSALPLCHCEPVRTLAWQSASPNVRRNSLHSVSAVTVSAAKTAYPLLPSSSPNQSTGFDLEKENRGNGYGAGGPKPGCGMECARLDADCHTSDIGHWFAMTCFFCPNNNPPAANAAGGAVLRLDLRFYPQISFVSRAMTSSSFVGITKTLTLLSGVEIMMSSPRLLLASGSISTPR